MILKRFYDEKLAHASYLIGCPGAGEACVIDANREVNQYLEAAAAEGVRITAVTETHIHADYVSGSRELAEVTGATLFLSDEGTPDWKYGFASQPNVKLVRDLDSIRIGAVRLDVIRTPGHTPEHIAFILTDEAAGNVPLAAFTGDFVFVGDVGRPDLLERAAGFLGTMEAGARTLFGSLQQFKRTFPDSLLLWPAHGAGSACGKALGGSPVTSLGYEKQTNWGLRASTEGGFIEEVLAGQPEPPTYFKEMKRINRDGPSLIGGFRMPPRLAGSKLTDILAQDATVIDVRPAEEAAAGLIPGTINIPEDNSFTNWAGWLTPYDKPIYVLSSGETNVGQAVRDLAMIGLDDVQGWLGEDALRAYEEERGALDVIPQLGIEEALDLIRSKAVSLIDVRGLSEWVLGSIPGALHVPLGYLTARQAELDRTRPVVVYCESGARSAIAASLLRGLGFADVSNLRGGYSEYEREASAHPSVLAG